MTDGVINHEALSRKGLPCTEEGQLNRVEVTHVLTDCPHNAKVAYLMAAVCRHHEKDIPAFPGGRWIIDTFSTDEISVLMSHYQECLRLAGPIEFDLSSERLDGLARLLAAHADTDAPNIALSQFTQSQLGEIIVRLSVMLKEARDSSEASEASETSAKQKPKSKA